MHHQQIYSFLFQFLVNYFNQTFNIVSAVDKVM